MTITEFLLARIAEDEQKARQGDHRDRGHDIDWASMAEGDVLIIGTDRVLAECEAKRRIVALHTSCDDVSYGDPSTCPEMRILASVYADHPDFRAEWRTA